LGYRALSVFQFGGHPTYVVLATPTDWQPFLLFLSKLSTFVLGMVVGWLYTQGRGPIFWRSQRALLLGLPIYALGFVCQFYRLGWVVVDLLLPIGLLLCGMVLFRFLARFQSVQPALAWMGVHSYSYFLVHNFVVDRTINLVVRDDFSLYTMLLPVMVVGTLMLAVVVDHTQPFLRKIVVGILRDLDYVLTPDPVIRRRAWHPQVGDLVAYQGKEDWTVLKLEKLLDEREFFLCQISNGMRSLWVNEDDLEPAGILPPSGEVSRNT
jgi:peptidoglycan/LPS O-acetylase OafA/YrhL